MINIFFHKLGLNLMSYSDTCAFSLPQVCPCRLPHGAVHPALHHHARQAAYSEQPVWDWHTVSALPVAHCATLLLLLLHGYYRRTWYSNLLYQSINVGFCRKLKKMLRRRKSELDSKQEEELNKTLKCYEKDHILGPFAGLNPEYMEMSKSKFMPGVNHCTNICNMCMSVLCQAPVFSDIMFSCSSPDIFMLRHKATTNR